MGYLKDFQDFFSSERIHTAIKITVSVVVILGTVWVIDSIGFCRWSEEKRLNEIILLNKILEDQTLTSQERQSLITERNSAISRKNISLRLIKYASNIFQRDTGLERQLIHTAKMNETAENIKYGIEYKTNTESFITIQDNQTTDTLNVNTPRLSPTVPAISTIIDRSPISERNNIWFYFSVNWWIIILFLATLWLGIFINTDQQWTILKISLYTLIITLFYLPISLLSYWICGYIFRGPLLNHWWITYSLIASIPVIAYSIFYVIQRLFTRKSK